LEDVPVDEIPIKTDITLSNSGLGSEGAPEAMNVLPVMANVGKRSTRMRRRIQMNGCECGEEVAINNREKESITLVGLLQELNMSCRFS
jgi:hypothetical protein